MMNMEDFKNIEDLNKWIIERGLINHDLENWQSVQPMAHNVEQRERDREEGDMIHTTNTDDLKTIEELDNWATHRGLMNDDLVKLRRIQLMAEDLNQREIRREERDIIAIIDAFKNTEDLNKWASNRGLMNDDLVNLRRIQLMCDETNQRETEREEQSDTGISYTSNNKPSLHLLSEYTSQDLKFLSLNLCGLKSKLNIPEFKEMVSTYDIIALQETKLNDVDYVDLAGYTIICQNRRKTTIHRSGGTAFLFKTSLSQHFESIKSESDLIQWIRISKSITKTDGDIYCGNMYIPPQGSKYASQDPYLEIQTELNEHCREMKYIVLLGDFNSRTGSLLDYEIAEDYLSKIQDNGNSKNGKAHMLYTLEERGVSLTRRSADSAKNTYGLQLLKFCKRNGLLILNGRLGNDFLSPQPTCQGRSTIDYCISSISFLNHVHVHDFGINDFSSLYSDSHSGVSLTIKSNND